jgi:hypothetical protein
MSIYEKELRERLSSGEDVEDIARWFIERMAEGPRPDLSEFEVKFFKRIVAAFLEWQSKQKPETRGGDHNGEDDDHQVLIDDEIWERAREQSGLDDPTPFLMGILIEAMRDSIKRRPQ